MSHLTRHDYASVLALLGELEGAAAQGPSLLDVAIARLPAFIACETAELRSDEPMQGRGVLSVTVGDGKGGGPRTALVLRRRKSAFSERDRDRLALLLPHLAWLHAQSVRRSGSIEAQITLSPTASPAPVRTRSLTPREHDVMRWLSCGKTDADIAALLAISKRTVHKHLEHIYEKLGVETRTAAVMALGKRANHGQPASGGLG